MGDADREIIRLLTEIRDEQRAEAAYRRQYLEESAVQNREAMALQKRAVRGQRRVAVVWLLIFLTAVGAMIYFNQPAAREPPPRPAVPVAEPVWPGGGPAGPPGKFRFRPQPQPAEARNAGPGGAHG